MRWPWELSHVRHVNVPSQDKIDSRPRPGTHGFRVTVQQSVDIVGTHDMNRVVRYNDAQLRSFCRPQSTCNAINLRVRNLAVHMPLGAGRVDADDEQGFTVVFGFQLLTEGTGEVGIRLKETREWVEKGDVVVAWYHQSTRDGETVHEAFRLGELAPPSALGDVPGKHRNIRFLALDQLEQCEHCQRLFGAEVRIGDLHQDALHPCRLSLKPDCRPQTEVRSRQSSNCRVKNSG